MPNMLLAYMMFFVSLLFYSYQFIFRVLPSFIVDEMMQKFAVDADSIGNFGAIYYAGYAAAHIPIGFFVDKFGAKIVMTISSACIALGVLPMIFTNSWAMIMVGRVVIGIGSVASVLGMFKLIRLGFGAKAFGFMVGITTTVALVTVAETTSPIITFVAKHGMDAFLKLLAAISVVTTVLVFIIVPRDSVLEKKYANNMPSDGKKASQSMRDIFNDFMQVLGDHKVILISVIGGLMIGASAGFADAWAPTFLKVVYGLSEEQASLGSKAAFYGMAVGSPLIGYAIEKMRSYMGVIFWSAVGMFLCMIILMLVLCNIPMMLLGFQLNVIHVVLFFMGVMCGYQVGILTGVTEIASPRFFSLASATGNMIMMGFGTFFHKGIGIVIAKSTAGGEYTKSSLLLGVLIVPVCLVLSVLLLGVLANAMKKARSAS